MGKYGIIGDFVFEIQEVKLGEKMVHPGRLLAEGSPFGPLLKQRYLPLCLLRNRISLKRYHCWYLGEIWCTQEDSNFRPLGS